MSQMLAGENTPALKVVTSTQTVTDSATLVAASALQAKVRKGRRYRFKAMLQFTTVNSSGVKVDCGGPASGAATFTSFIGRAAVTGQASYAGEGNLGGGKLTASTTAVGVTATSTAALVEVEGMFLVNAGGTFALRFAQNAETGAAESVILLANSWLEIQEVKG